MGLSVVRFEKDQQVRWGIHEQAHVAVLEQTFPSHRELMQAYFAQPDAFRSTGLERLSIADIHLLAPVTRDVQIFCQSITQTWIHLQYVSIWSQSCEGGQIPGIHGAE